LIFHLTPGGGEMLAESGKVNGANEAWEGQGGVAPDDRDIAASAMA
jgi:hypothetical protein